MAALNMDKVNELVDFSHEMFCALPVEDRAKWISTMESEGWQPRKIPGATPEMIEAAQVFMNQIRNALEG